MLSSRQAHYHIGPSHKSVFPRTFYIKAGFSMKHLRDEEEKFLVVQFHIEDFLLFTQEAI